MSSSKTRTIEQNVKKIKALLQSVVSLIPDCNPKSDSIYGLAFSLNECLQSPSQTSLKSQIFDKFGKSMTNDLNSSDLDFDSLNGNEFGGYSSPMPSIGKVLDYQQQITELVDMLKNSIPLDSIAVKLARILNIDMKSVEVSESAVKDLFDRVKVELENKNEQYDLIKFKFDQYQEKVNSSIRTLDLSRLNSNTKMLFDSILSYNF
ncbi:hypothetical protein TRFO_32939 [Tritrichomonas foetus]|uniref:Uncharacterized protein n=1 Tax=Tritrichomonas foetus TaxID=1144522 RepID=A0A1J4JPR4_9EUKA|nr:hypothetical protein TRFO_32939 [Tritrichomonas foetus]|eukprot:OHT00400.1 hypothetical protein TRFO_32939 [Tritrichomonas foetus]